MYIFNKIKSMYCIMNNLSHILTYCMGKENYTIQYTVSMFVQNAACKEQKMDKSVTEGKLP